VEGQEGCDIWPLQHFAAQLKVEGQEGCDIQLLQHFAVKLGVEGLGCCGDFVQCS
jgi:hypothetical protein